jgi:hypothetical protein
MVCGEEMLYYNTLLLIAVEVRYKMVATQHYCNVLNILNVRVNRINLGIYT